MQMINVLIGFFSLWSVLVVNHLWRIHARKERCRERADCERFWYWPGFPYNMLGLSLSSFVLKRQGAVKLLHGLRTCCYMNSTWEALAYCLAMGDQPCSICFHFHLLFHQFPAVSNCYSFLFSYLNTLVLVLLLPAMPTSFIMHSMCT